MQEAWVAWPDVVYDKVGNIQLSRILGGDVRLDPAGFDIGIRDSWQKALDSVVDAGGKPYPIPAGASDHELGGLGFANWAREVAQQEAEHDIFFDHIIVCTVTGSTHAGMIAGFALEDAPTRHVIGIDASATMDKTMPGDQSRRTRRRRSAGSTFARRRDHLVDGYSAASTPSRCTDHPLDPICARLKDADRPRVLGKSMAA